MSSRSSAVAVLWGAAIGVLGGLIGLGGAEFRLPVLLEVFRFPPLDAVILNKAMSLFVVAAALLFRARAVPLDVLAAHWPVAIDLLAGSLVGAWCGAGWAIRLRSDIFYRVISALLVLLALMLLIAHQGLAITPRAVPLPGVYILGVLAGFGIGAIAALLGVAGGELIIPTLVLLFGLDAKVAGSLSLAISLPTMITGFARYSQDRSFAVLRGNSTFVAFMAGGSVLGAFCGGMLLRMAPARFLLLVLALILALSAIRIWQHAQRKPEVKPAGAFDFELEPVRALTYIPLRFRMHLDLCAVHLSQRQWNKLPYKTRHALIGAPVGSDVERERFRGEIARSVHEAGGGSVRFFERQEPAWRNQEVPVEVRDTLQSLYLPVMGSDTWRAMSDDRRFALFKLSRPGHSKNLGAALREFGLVKGGHA